MWKYFSVCTRMGGITPANATRTIRGCLVSSFVYPQYGKQGLYPSSSPGTPLTPYIYIYIYRRFLQCIRRYKDTRNIFPHLVNCGKYTASILAGVFLSTYRIHNTNANLALFVAFSSVNGIYTCKLPLNTLFAHSHYEGFLLILPVCFFLRSLLGCLYGFFPSPTTRPLPLPARHHGPQVPLALLLHHVN